jgi:hypothetical protein
MEEFGMPTLMPCPLSVRPKFTRRRVAPLKGPEAASNLAAVGSEPSGTEMIERIRRHGRLTAPEGKPTQIDVTAVHHRDDHRPY